jgi:hypothetical protein
VTASGIWALDIDDLLEIARRKARNRSPTRSAASTSMWIDIRRRDVAPLLPRYERHHAASARRIGASEWGQGDDDASRFHWKSLLRRDFLLRHGYVGPPIERPCVRKDGLFTAFRPFGAGTFEISATGCARGVHKGSIRLRPEARQPSRVASADEELRHWMGCESNCAASLLAARHHDPRPPAGGSSAKGRANRSNIESTARH